MDFGVQVNVYRTEWSAVRASVEAMEAGDWDSVWFADHFIPPGGGGDDQQEAMTAFEGLAAIAMAAGMTQKLRLGNLVLGVYRNDFAVRMLKASVPSGIEAPLRFYLTENADATATLTYRKPSAIFGVCDSSDLDAMAKELDNLWAKIVSGTTGK